MTEPEEPMTASKIIAIFEQFKKDNATFEVHQSMANFDMVSPKDLGDIKIDIVEPSGPIASKGFTPEGGYLVKYQNGAELYLTSELLKDSGIDSGYPLYERVEVKPDCGHGEVIKCEVRVNAAWHKVQWCWDCLEPFAKEGLVIYPPAKRGGRRV